MTPALASARAPLRARVLQSLAVCAAALAGCGDGGGGGAGGRGDAPPPRASTEEVAMSLNRTVTQPGATLRLTIRNRGDERLEYGLAYRLERWGDGAWDWVNRDAAFALILKVAEPGSRERERIGLPKDLAAGTYRIVKEFTAQPAARRFEAEVRFAVR